MNEKSFNEVKRREIKRFHGAVDTVVDNLLLKKYEETRSAEEYREYSRICGLVKTNLHVMDLVADRMDALFERPSERSNWEVYLTGLRNTARRMPRSYFFRFVLPMMGLEDLREKLSAYCAKSLDQFHASHKTLSGVDSYLHNLTMGHNVASEYQGRHSELSRLYASVKTWESKGDFDAFFDGLKDFLDLSVEVFVAGPIQLYLMIGRDTFVAIFKGLTVGKLGDLQGDAREHREMLHEMLHLHDFVHGSIAESKTLAVFQEIVREAVQEYVKRLREEQERLRTQLPTRELMRRFIGRFESGVLFQSQTD